MEWSQRWISVTSSLGNVETENLDIEEALFLDTLSVKLSEQLDSKLNDLKDETKIIVTDQSKQLQPLVPQTDIVAMIKVVTPLPIKPPMKPRMDPQNIPNVSSKVPLEIKITDDGFEFFFTRRCVPFIKSDCNTIKTMIKYTVDDIHGMCKIDIFQQKLSWYVDTESNEGYPCLSRRYIGLDHVRWDKNRVNVRVMQPRYADVLRWDAKELNYHTTSPSRYRWSCIDLVKSLRLEI
jgi:hypothetical protein